MSALFAAWRQKSAATLKALQAGFHPKEVSTALAEDLLARDHDGDVEPCNHDEIHEPLRRSMLRRSIFDGILRESPNKTGDIV